MGGINEGARGKDFRNRDQLKGITWEFFNREQYVGDIINPTNRNFFLKKKYLGYIEASETYADASDEEKRTEERIAYIKARNYINRMVKQERAYNKGKNSYNFHKEKYMVPTVDRVARFKESLAEIEEKYKAGELTFEEE